MTPFPAANFPPPVTRSFFDTRDINLYSCRTDKHPVDALRSQRSGLLNTVAALITLTHKQIFDITSILENIEEEPSSKKDKERRRAPRMPLHTPLHVTILTGNLGPTPCVVNVVSRSISASGIGFVGRRMLRQNERVAIAVHLPQVPARLILGRIAFCRYLKAGLYEMGAEFLATVPDPTRRGEIPRHWLYPSLKHVRADTESKVAAT